ncbi:hypothetical protein K502DRAFT_316055 [Neoconidiobolus thromboides FSU 785]|nr:hypothetical protein K502DRAFT_316055 [Neoconidiobolus thromboides FSU 785]
MKGLLSLNLKRTRCVPGLKYALGLKHTQLNLNNLKQLKFKPQSQLFHTSFQPQKIVAFNLADIGEGITECELIQWFIQPGDKIAQFDRICEVQSDKASVEITSRYDGVVTKLHCEAGNMAKVGSPLVDIDTEEIEEVSTLKEEKNSTSEETVVNTVIEDIKVESEVSDIEFSNQTTFATPAVRRIARENKVNLSQVLPTGKGNRILKEDILAFINGKQTQVEQKVPESKVLPINLTPVSNEEQIVPLSLVQKAMFKTMTNSLSIPHFGYSDEFNLNSANQLRQLINAQLAKSNDSTKPKKISYMPILIKALSVALKEFPLLNARLIYENEVPKLAYRNYHHIGVAMDTPNGLLVPNIKNVENKSIIEIAEELNKLQEAGKKNSITSGDLKNGTITLSNIGTVGGTYLSPVVVTSELCIGALGRIQKLPRFEVKVDELTGKSIETVVAHNIMPISFSADHRVVDGATLARFSEKWRQLVEDPVSLIAYLK